MEYTVVKIEYMTKEIVTSQLSALKRGFNKLIPEAKVNKFTVEEFDRLLCGDPHIDLKDWKRHTNYRGHYHETHKVIQWFWDCLEGYTQDQL